MPMRSLPSPTPTVVVQLRSKYISHQTRPSKQTKTAISASTRWSSPAKPAVQANPPQRAPPLLHRDHLPSLHQDPLPHPHRRLRATRLPFRRQAHQPARHQWALALLVQHSLRRHLPPHTRRLWCLLPIAPTLHLHQLHHPHLLPEPALLHPLKPLQPRPHQSHRPSRTRQSRLLPLWFSQPYRSSRARLFTRPSRAARILAPTLLLIKPLTRSFRASRLCSSPAPRPSAPNALHHQIPAPHLHPHQALHQGRLLNHQTRPSSQPRQGRPLNHKTRPSSQPSQLLQEPHRQLSPPQCKFQFSV